VELRYLSDKAGHRPQVEAVAARGEEVRPELGDDAAVAERAVALRLCLLSTSFFSQSAASIAAQIGNTPTEGWGIDQATVPRSPSSTRNYFATFRRL
jgi:hypothetical protein